ENVFAIDTDLGRIEWQKHFNLAPAEGSSTCPGGMTAAVASPATSAFPMGNAGGRGNGGRGGPAKSGVGQPFEGAVTISQAVAAPPQALFPQGAIPPGRAGRGPARMPELLHALSSDGLLHAMYVSNGEEPALPLKF